MHKQPSDGGVGTSQAVPDGLADVLATTSHTRQEVKPDC